MQFTRKIDLNLSQQKFNNHKTKILRKYTNLEQKLIINEKNLC